jgi:RNA polymerase sigma factor (sigma-70 family)
LGHYGVVTPEYESAADDELIRASLRDPASFEVLYGRHAGPMRRWFARQVGEVAVANDLLAETFAQAWGARRRFSGDGSGAGAAWLFGIARHQLYQHFKRGRVEVSARRRLGMSTRVPHDDDLESILERLDAEALREELETALNELPVAQRDAIDARVVRGLSYGEVALELGCTEDKARARVSRGLRSLNWVLKEART